MLQKNYKVIERFKINCQKLLERSVPLFEGTFDVSYRMPDGALNYLIKPALM